MKCIKKDSILEFTIDHNTKDINIEGKKLKIKDFKKDYEAIHNIQAEANKDKQE